MKKKSILITFSLLGILTLASCNLFDKEKQTLVPVNPTEEITTPEVSHQHTWNEPTYKWSSSNDTVIATRVCSKKKKKETDRAYTEEYVVTPATCTIDGVSTFTTEPFDNPAFTIQTKEATIKAHHTKVVDPMVSPTYYETGLTEGAHCSVCGEIITPQNVIPKLVLPTYVEYVWTDDFSSVTANKYSTSTNELLSTETKPTTNKVTTVGNCNTKEIITYTVNFDNDDFDTQVKNIATNYKHQEIVSKTGTPATCTTPGYTEEISCSICNKVLKESQTIEALGHKVETIPTLEPTFLENGHISYKKCSVCGINITEPTILKSLQPTIIPLKFDYQNKIKDDSILINYFNLNDYENVVSNILNNSTLYFEKNSNNKYDFYIKFYKTDLSETFYSSSYCIDFLDDIRDQRDNDSASDYECLYYNNQSIISYGENIKIEYLDSNSEVLRSKEFSVASITSGNHLYKIDELPESTTSLGYSKLKIYFSTYVKSSEDGSQWWENTSYYWTCLEYLLK